MEKFKNKIIRVGCIFLPLALVYFWIPKELREGFPAFFIASCIAAYELGKLIGKVMLDEKYP